MKTRSGKRVSFQSNFICDSEETQLSTTHVSIKTKHIRKLVCDKIIHNHPFNPQKSTNFKARVASNQLATLVPQNRVECPICLQILIAPVLLDCGHLYCLKCIESNIIYHSKCCLCRQIQDVDTAKQSLLTQKIIQTFVLPQSQQVIKYLCRQTDYSQWIKRRRLGQYHVGMVVDYRDVTTNIWKKAMISKIYEDKNNKKIQLKWYINKHELREKIDANSRKIAPANFFTKGLFLKEFQPTLLFEDRDEIINFKIENSQIDFFESEMRVDHQIFDNESQFYQNFVQISLQEELDINRNYFQIEQNFDQALF